ncbi:GTP-binding protein [Veronia nyctiphanis]|uniref:GTP-binding protein n=1 Tax=Veronia nyctiphanis TaxID=1278244 RepID=A0A4Q0YT28_9GAMM|nr:GTP-binding protein [Veronia nyctiphanis]RXJ72131.1 GTP-binding protein [Veronia nyctiphanis]
MTAKLTHKVPTNIITGFLGAGKTTAILSLLESKSKDERWAVLVNEFGEVGVDGAFLSEQGAIVKEVPGGCMCCVAGLPMAVGINALLAQNPDRLLIEPTGLGHPKDIIGKLLSENYEKYIDLRATITLVDPRNFADKKYTENQNFKDQINLADVLVANKVDLCDDDDLAAFDECFHGSAIAKAAKGIVSEGKLDSYWLDLPRTNRNAEFLHHHSHDTDIPAFELVPGERFARKENKGQGYNSCGWVFTPEIVFPFDALYGLLGNINAERVKAVVNTDDGMFAFNIVNQVVSVSAVSLEGVESKLEIIDKMTLPWDDLEDILLSLLPEA